MAEEKDLKVEILVHASAPSRGGDDRRYRALTSAYLDFEPASYWRLLEDEPDGKSTILDRELDALLQEDCMIQESNDENYGDVEQPGLQLLAGLQMSNISPKDPGKSLESPEISFNSTSDNLNSPPIRHLTRSVEFFPDEDSPSLSVPNQDRQETPQSVVRDSQSSVGQNIPDFSSPTRDLNLYLQHFDTFSSQVSRSSSDASTLLVPSSPPVATREGRVEYPSLPGSKGCLSATTTPSRRPQSNVVFLQSPVTNHYNNLIRSQSPAGFASDLAKRGRIEFISLGTTSEDVSFVQDTPIRSPRLPLSSSPIRHYHGTIHPPPPKTSVDPLAPQSLFTPYLLLLARQLSLSSRYRPRIQSRPLRPFERGYWSVSMRVWDEGLRGRAWSALSRYVRSGRAGWGVWASREGAIDTEGLHNGMEREFAGDELRAYCWGEVVGHIYLLLYLVSERKIKGKGVRWVDGEGRVVIIMGS
jgi:hypothetical protein